MLTDRNFSPKLESKVKEWLAYKKEKNQKYKATGLQNLLSQIQNNANKYGDDALIYAMSISMANGYQGIVYDKAREYQTNGGDNSGASGNSGNASNSGQWNTNPNRL
jgi:hypothetical protein